MSAMRLAVAGAGGRMGRTLIRAISELQGAAILAGAVESSSSPHLGEDAGLLAGVGALGVKIGGMEGLGEGIDGLLDFTVPKASVGFSETAAVHKFVHVIGSTGFDADEDAAIARAASKTAIVKSGNMSLGVNLLAQLVRQAAKALDSSFDIEILEMHHRAKVDAPSGTALLLGQAAAEGRGIDLTQQSIRGRDGITGARPAGKIGFASLRGGTVVGDHSVILAGAGERIELTHRAEDRALFANGALKAALWARGREPGLYSMADVLGLA